MSTIISQPIGIVNQITGEVTNYDGVYEQRTELKCKAASGFTTMYRNGRKHAMELPGNRSETIYEVGYDGIARSLTSELEYDIFTYIRDSYIPKTNVLRFKQTEIVTKLNTSSSAVGRVVAKLKKLNFIRKDGAVWRMNPYIYLAPFVTGELAYTLQEEWKSLLSSDLLKDL